MESLHPLQLMLLRARSKSPRQFLRTLFLRVWPLSLFARAYYRLRWMDGWRRIANRRAVGAFAAHAPHLETEQRRCLIQLRQEGMCVTSVAHITDDTSLLARLRTKVAAVLNQPEVRTQIEQRRAGHNPKWYVIRGLGYGAQITLPDAFAELFLHPRILATVNSYWGQYARLAYADLWCNLPVKDGEPSIDSERWHRDHEDRHVLKLYCLVEEVDESMGPLRYVRGSHPVGTYADVLPTRPPQGSYPSQAAFDAAIPRETHFTCVGEAGTLFLCDTAGFHCGGRSASRPRIVLTATYVSESGLDQRTFHLERAERFAALDAQGRFALHRE